jgi:hypothetical protein
VSFRLQTAALYTLDAMIVSVGLQPETFNPRLIDRAVIET